MLGRKAGRIERPARGGGRWCRFSALASTPGVLQVWGTLRAYATGVGEAERGISLRPRLSSRSEISDYQLATPFHTIRFFSTKRRIVPLHECKRVGCSAALHAELNVLLSLVSEIGRPRQTFRDIVSRSGIGYRMTCMRCILQTVLTLGLITNMVISIFPKESYCVYV
jgi:hypothetical protein